MRRALLAYGLVVVVALTVRLAYWAEIRGTALAQWHLWGETDMATYVEQARRIAAGDWLCPDPYHPYHLWQKDVGTEQDWLRWYGRHGFHQAPLYSFLLAGLMTATGETSPQTSPSATQPAIRPQQYVELVKLAQLVLGAGTSLLLALVARRLAGDVAGVMTGLLCGLYGPLFYLEAELLREGPAIFGFALLLWLVVGHISRAPTRFPWSAAGIGVLLGIFAMFHEFALVLTVATLLVLVLHAGSRSVRRGAVTSAAVVAGYLVGFSPLLARNIAVGAAPLSVSSRPHLTLALANMSSARDGGIMFALPGRQFREILDASDGTTFGVMREVWRGYEGNRFALVRNWLGRLGAALWTVEIADNVSFDFHRSYVRAARASVTFGVIFPPAAAAILACVLSSLMERRRGAEAGPIITIWREHRAVLLAVLAYIPPILFAASLVNVQGRYRLILVPIVLCFAGVFAAMIVRAVQVRRASGALALLLVAAVVAFLQRRASAPWIDLDRRSVDRAITAQQYVLSGNAEAALPFYRDALRLNPTDFNVRLHFANTLGRLGHFEESLREFEIIERAQPNRPGIRSAIRFLQAKLAPGTTTGKS